MVSCVWWPVGTVYRNITGNILFKTCTDCRRTVLVATHAQGAFCVYSVRACRLRALLHRSTVYSYHNIRILKSSSHFIMCMPMPKSTLEVYVSLHSIFLSTVMPLYMLLITCKTVGTSYWIAFDNIVTHLTSDNSCLSSRVPRHNAGEHDGTHVYNYNHIYYLRVNDLTRKPQWGEWTVSWLKSQQARTDST